LQVSASTGGQATSATPSLALDPFGWHWWLAHQCPYGLDGTGGLPTSVGGDRLASMPTHYKTVRRVHDPGDCHEITSSCYHGMLLLTNDAWLRMLAQSVDRAIRRHDFRLVAFVFMPEHVHLLVYPTLPEPQLDLLLKAIKRPFSFRVKQELTVSRSPLLATLTIHERPGVECFRFWQEGGGYDRNLKTETAVRSSIEYIHLNPVRRGLCERAVDWKWSSARHYHQPGDAIDPDLPEISGLPPEFFM
jgi:putative transposase